MQSLSSELEAASQQRKKTVRTAVAGVGGYAGGELARLLLAHPRLGATRPVFLGRVADESPSGRVPLEQIQPQLALGAGEPLPGDFGIQLEDDSRCGRGDCVSRAAA